MKVLLIEPPFSPDQVHTQGFGLAEPLSLELLAGNLRHHDVRILDMRIDPDLRKHLASFRPDIVGAGCYATGLYLIKRLMREVKDCDPSVLTVVGGHHASLLPRDFHDEAIDVIGVGEGEITLRELVDTRERGGDLREVAGLALRDGDGEFFRTPRRPLADLDDLPLPDRSLVDGYRKRYFRGSWRPIASLTTERGCPFRCRFCSMWKVNEGKYRLRSPESVVDEIAALDARYIDFIDDNTLHDVKRATQMYDLIKGRGIRKTYKTYARSDTVTRHPEIVEKWREIGMELVLIGFESFRDEDLQAWGKRNSIRNNEEAIRILHANGVEIAAYFVVNPDYTHEDFDALSAYVAKWRLTHPIFTILTPLPGTDLFADVYDRLLTHNYEYFDFFHSVLPTRLPSAEFYKRFAGLWKTAYSFRNTLKKIGRGKLAISPRQVLGFREFMSDLDALAEKTFAPVPDAGTRVEGSGQGGSKIGQDEQD